MENFPKSFHYHGPGGPLAWRQLDVCHLWRHSRGRAGCGTLLLPCQIEIKRCGSSSPLHWFLLSLGAENSDIQHTLLKPGLLPGDFPSRGGAIVGRIVQFRMAEGVRLSVLHALSFLYPFARCGCAAGSRQSRIPIRNLAVRCSNRPRGRRTCRAGTFFREQSKCVRLLPVLSPARSSIQGSCLESVRFSSPPLNS